MNDITKTIAGALLVGGSLAVGNPLLITAAGGVGVNWTSEGLQGLGRAWTGRKLNTPLARAYARALKSAAARLRSDYAKRDSSAQELGAFNLISACADDFANAEFPPTRLDASAAQAQLAQGLDALLYGYDSREFIKDRLMASTALALRDELAIDGEAWMRFHGWVLEDLRQSQGEMSAKLDHVSQTLDRFADPQVALQDMQNSLVRIDATTGRIDIRTERIEEKIDKLLSQPPNSGPVFNNQGMTVNGNVFQSGTLNISNNMTLQNPPQPANLEQTQKTLAAMNRTQLRDWLVKKFKSNELSGLCLDIQTELEKNGIQEDVSLDIIGGDTLPMQCQNLIGHLERRGYLAYLIHIAAKLRPNAQ